MNEQKIKELVLATGEVEYDWRGYMKYNSSEDLVEKLIEVVVRECIDICLRNHINNIETISAGECAYDIQQHFGVD
jgi:hypothetical protein